MKEHFETMKNIDGKKDVIVNFLSDCLSYGDDSEERERKHLFNENRAFNSHKKPLEKHHFNMLNCSSHRTTVKGGLALNNY